MRKSFAEYLVERGAISVAQGGDVIEWARQSRDLLGTIAMEHGVLNGEQIRAVVRHQREDGGMFGDSCIELGYMDRRELEVLLRTQDLRTSRFEAERVMLAGLVPTEELGGFMSGYYAQEQGSGSVSEAA